MAGFPDRGPPDADQVRQQVALDLVDGAERGARLGDGIGDVGHDPVERLGAVFDRLGEQDAMVGHAARLCRGGKITDCPLILHTRLRRRGSRTEWRPPGFRLSTARCLSGTGFMAAMLAENVAPAVVWWWWWSPPRTTCAPGPRTNDLGVASAFSPAVLGCGETGLVSVSRGSCVRSRMSPLRTPVLDFGGWR